MSAGYRGVDGPSHRFLPRRIANLANTPGTGQGRNVMKVPLLVSWLSENGLLKQAARMVLSPTEDVVLQPTETGVLISCGSEKTGFLNETFSWDDHFLLTLSQLLELGFDPGDDARIMAELLR